MSRIIIATFKEIVSYIFKNEMFLKPNHIERGIAVIKSRLYAFSATKLTISTMNVRNNNNAIYINRKIIFK